MLIFHEGLPGSGKSYAAFADHIIPALKKGRHVYAYVEGLDFAKIAEASEITLERAGELLHQITREEVPTIYKHVENDSLVVIDELQNFWPSGRQRLDPEITQFVTEHRHRGLDVLTMGQVLGDCHSLWKGRIDTKIVFMKRDAVGKADEYRWTVFKNLAGKFKETTTGKKAYESKYFGCYKSHTDDTENIGTYADDRANVKNSRAYKVAKIFAVVFVVSVGTVIWFFASGGGGIGQQKKPEASKAVLVDPNAIAAAQNAQVIAAAVKPPPATPVELMQAFQSQAMEYVDELADKGRIRLGGVLKTSSRMTGVIEWRDSSNRVIEQLTPVQLQALGWYVMLSPDGSMATVSKLGKTYVATQWPTKDDRSGAPERVPSSTQDIIRADTPPPALALKYSIEH